MTVEEINKICRNTFVDYMGIEFVDFGENYVVAQMSIDPNKLQPMGLLHGGVSLALAETVGSGGSLLLVDNTAFSVLGLQVTGNHIASVSEGRLIARGEIIHKGQLTHIWDVKISTDDGKLISVARVTNIIIEKKGGKNPDADCS
jgi:1,4-dihydroxy-2-naphthoyl-CoA hydrolase